MHSHLIIGGDTFPSMINFEAFGQESGELIYGTEICRIFKNADFSIINLEGCFTDSAVRLEKSGPNIKAPLTAFKGITELGVNAVALANNHVMDYGKKGYCDTVKVLEKRGITHIGSGMTEDSIVTHMFVDMEGMNVCIYNVAQTEFNIATSDSPGVNRFEEYRVCSELVSLKEKCDYLVVIYHGGTEKFRYPTPRLRRRFHLMADCGADLILAQHTHCIGCEEIYNSARLLYGQGNFCFSREEDEYTSSGLLIDLDFENGKVDCKYRKIRRNGAYVEMDPTQDLSDFYERSKRIEDEEFLSAEYKKYCNALIGNFTRCVGRKDFAGRVLRKLIPNAEGIKNQSGLLYLINAFRCEAHQENIVTALLDMLEQ